MNTTPAAGAATARSSHAHDDPPPDPGAALHAAWEQFAARAPLTDPAIVNCDVSDRPHGVQVSGWLDGGSYRLLFDRTYPDPTHPEAESLTCVVLAAADGSSRELDTERARHAWWAIAPAVTARIRLLDEHRAEAIDLDDQLERSAAGPEAIDSYLRVRMRRIRAGEPLLAAQGALWSAAQTLGLIDESDLDSGRQHYGF